MKQPIVVFAALFLITGCATQLSQTPPAGMPAQVMAAGLQVGNHWRYAVRDGFTNLPRGTVEYRVSAVQGDTVKVEVRDEGRESTEIYTRDGNWLSRPATNMQLFTYSPAYRAFAFPLASGKTWKSRVTATDPADGRRFPVMIEGAVLGWDRIKVPAGEFDALRVRRFVYLDYWQQNVRGQSVIEENEWFAPAVNQVVRREATSKYLSYIYGGSRPGFVLARGRGRDDGGRQRHVRGGGGRDDGSSPTFIQDDWLIYELVSHSAR
ncbi:MAG: hypothetical protein HY322_16525 [Betaproteobacteria bacterium]|nr:hypothetical protein [Betaproteobacteria bacterium]